MPKMYEVIRDKFLKRGMDVKLAKKHAAMIYNSMNPDDPVGRYSDRKRKKKGVV